MLARDAASAAGASPPELSEGGTAEQPERSWGFQRGDEVVEGGTALRRLGGGAACEVYLVFDDRLLTPVVVKIVRPHLVEDPATLRRLRREAEMVGRLNHPAIVRGYSADPDGPRPHLVLEHVRGPRLATLLRRRGQLPLERVLPLGLHLSAALHHLRQLGVVHLDVKPSNIITGPMPRLIDLSIARVVSRARRLKKPVGTDRYMAPEQCDPVGMGPPGGAADVWGLGVTLFEAVAGFRPFRDASLDEQAPPQQRWPQLVDRPAPLPPSTPAALARVLRACLAATAADRPQPREVFDVFDSLGGG